MKKYFIKNKLLCLFITLFALLNSFGAVGIAYVLQNIVDSAINKDLLAFKRNMIISIVYFLIFGVVNYIYKFLTSILVSKIIENMRTDVFESTITSDYESLIKENMGNVISILSNDTKVIEDNYIKAMFSLIENIITFLITLIAFIYISPKVTVCLIVGVAFLGIIPNCTGSFLEKKQITYSEKNAQFIRHIKDYLDGIEVIKSFSKERFFNKEFKYSNYDVKKSKLNVDKVQAIGDSLSFIFGFLLMVIVIIVSAYQVLIGAFSLGTLIALVQLSNTFVNPIIQLMGNIAKIKGCNQIVKKIEKNTNYSKKNIKLENKEYIKKFIYLKDIGYKVDKKRILESINLNIEKGKKYLIIGQSGSGKSTLLKILAGLIRNYDGEIFCDEKNVKEQETNYYDEVSIVNQSVYIFDKPIRENIFLGLEEEKKKLQEIIDISCLKEVIDETNNDNLGENGKLLSGGERQRIAIARALYHRKSILLLDEITSSLDKQMGKKIEKNLLSIKDLTVISVSHKIDEQNMNLYDGIIHIENGHMKFIQLSVD